MSYSHGEPNREEQYSPPPSSLDLTDEAMQALATQTVALVTDYFAQLSDIPLFQYAIASKFTDRISSELPVEGEPLEQLMDDCRALFAASRHTGHPRFLGYVPNVATPVGAFADLIASALNPNVNTWRGAPAATELEKIVVRWLGSLIGYGDSAKGFLTSGGSISNLNALLMAHRAKSPEKVSEKGLWNAGAPMTIYASDRVHFSIPKAADVLGIGRDRVRLVKSDTKFRLDVSHLRQCIETDLSNGLRPFCIVGNAGTTETGAVDPLAEIAQVSEEYNLWFHVDGAYGTLAALDPRKRPLFDGIERADSIAINAHKWLYTPIDCGCLLFRDAEIRSALSFAIGDYVRLHEETEAETFAFCDYSIELSRRFRAFKLWMLLRYYGVQRIRAAIIENNNLADYFAECVSAAEDFELLTPVVLSICCFRYVPPSECGRLLKSVSQEEREQINAELDRLNARILYAVQRDGKAYLSNTNICGLYALRACMVNFRTTCADIDAVLDIVRDTARSLETNQ